MSRYNQARRDERRAQFDRECAEREAEQQRVAGLSIYERIQEYQGDEDLKEILLLIAEKAGVEVHEVP